MCTPWLVPLIALVAVLTPESKLRLDPPDDHGGYFSFAFSGDGRFLAAGTGAMGSYAGGTKHVIGGEAVLWDAGTGDLLHTFGSHGRNVEWVAFSRKGEWLFSGSQENGLIQGWSTAGGGGAVVRLDPGTPFARGVLPVVSPDGRTVAFVTEQKMKMGKKKKKLVTRETPLRIFDTRTGRERWSVDGPDVRALALDPGGRLLAVFFRRNWSSDGKTRFLGRSAKQWIELRELDSGRTVRKIENTWNVHALAFLPDGRSLAAVTRNEIIVWSVGTGAETKRFSVAGKTTPRRFAVSRDGSRIAFSRFMGDRVEVWDVRQRELVAARDYPPGQTVWWPAFSPRLDRMAHSRTGGPVIVDLPRGNERK